MPDFLFGDMRGWRFLKPGEKIKKGDQYMGNLEVCAIFSPDDWVKADGISGFAKDYETLVFRRKIAKVRW